jgi:hypothetical protein
VSVTRSYRSVTASLGSALPAHQGVTVEKNIEYHKTVEDIERTAKTFVYIVKVIKKSRTEKRSPSSPKDRTCINQAF